MGDNVGHGTVISGVVPGASPKVAPLPFTWLSLDRYASILGISPCNFNGATASPIFAGGTCQETFYRYSWQANDKVGRQDIAEAIKSAEDDLAQAVGFPLAPTWITEEVQPYPRFYRPEYYGGVYNARDQYVSLAVDWHKTISGGRRGSTLLATAAVVYYDLDSDNFFETARVSCATTLTDVREIKVYLAGQAGAQEWEIRPCRTKAITGGVFTADFWIWQMIDPNEQDDFPSDTDPKPLDIAGNPPAHVVATVDVYREYHDTTQVAAQFWWEPLPVVGINSLCDAAAFYHASQDGYLLVRDSELGQVMPMVATYDATVGWTTSYLDVDREPDLVKLWYQAGAIDQKYLANKSYDPLSDQFALWIAMVATARLERTVCSCDGSNVATLFERWREDLAEVQTGTTRYIDFTGDTLSNPLGTHRGEVEVWKKIKRYHISLGGAAV